MTDKQKLEAIKAELEKLQNIYSKDLPKYDRLGYEGKKAILKDLQDFIATLDEQRDNCDTCTNDKGCVACENGELYEGKPTDYTKSNEEKAKEICNHGIPTCDLKCESCNIAYHVDGLIQMAEWKDEQFKAEKQALIDKACEWIDYNNKNGGCFFDGWEDNLRKAMEE